MIIKFAAPITIEKARELYRDNVKFISSTNDYPNVQAIEFDGEDISSALNKKYVGPRVTKKANKIIGKYKKRINRIWNSGFNDIKEILSSVTKAEKLTVSEEDKQRVKEALAGLYNDLTAASDKYYEDAYRVGQLRGQIIANQELDDDDLNDSDYDIIEEYQRDAASYLENFKGDVDVELDRILSGEYDSADALVNTLDQEVKEAKRSRALMYSMAVLGLIVAGTIKELSDIASQYGESTVPSGGIWTLHPEEGKGGEVCEGCMENAGKFFTLKEFEAEYHTNDCLTNCRCDLDM